MFEILINTPIVADLIKRSEIHGLKKIMHKSETQGMQTFETGLYNLYKEGLITLEEALTHSDSGSNLRLRTSLEEGVDIGGESNFELKQDVEMGARFRETD